MVITSWLPPPHTHTPYTHTHTNPTVRGKGQDFLKFNSEDSITKINMKYKLKTGSTKAALYRFGTGSKRNTGKLQHV